MNPEELKVSPVKGGAGEMPFETIKLLVKKHNDLVDAFIELKQELEKHKKNAIYPDYEK